MSADDAKRAAFAALDRSDHADELQRILDVLMIYAATGQEFSANEARADLKWVQKSGRIGRAFSLAISEGWLEPVALVKSSKRNTHAKEILRYVGRLAA